MANPSVPVWVTGLHFKSYILLEDGILVARLFSFYGMIELYFSIVSMLGVVAWIGSIRATNGSHAFPSAMAAIIFITIILLYPLSYTISAARRRWLSGKRVEELASLKSVNLVKWSEIRRVTQVGGAFSIWTAKNKLVLRASRKQIDSVEGLLHEKTNMTWTPMRRKWKALLGCVTLIVFGFISAFMQWLSWKFQLPKGSSLIVYPFIVVGCLALILSIVLFVYFAIKLETVTDNRPTLV